MYAMDRTIHEEHRREPRRQPWGSRRDDTLRPPADTPRRERTLPTPTADEFAD